MKKLLTVFLVLVMFVSIIPAQVMADETITVYVSVSRYGDFVQDKNGNLMAYVPIELNGQNSYTIDDVFSLMHELYYPDGVEGYATSYSEEWGLGVDKLWGDISYNFGYQVNGGRVSVMGPGHEVEDGDSIDACIYKNTYQNLEKYARFEATVEETYREKEVCLTLSYVSGYDDHWNSIFSPCEGATIYIDGEETDYITNENGEVTMSFSEMGMYLISAKKTQMVGDTEMPAITAPVCVVNVAEKSEIQIINNIAKSYEEMDFEDAGGNLPWILADMVVYEELFPESDYCLNEERKLEGFRIIADFAGTATRPGDLAKSILALRALGYDARQLYTASFETINLVEKLLALVDSQDESVTNIYTLPYVIIALRQSEEYANEEQMEWLLESAFMSKSAWQDTTEGTDALTPMLLALAPYCDENVEVDELINESIGILTSEQREDGLIDGFEGYEPASTGLAICGLSAVGIDASEVKNSENSLIDGLVSVANEDLGGFANAFATEQGFRGLLAWYQIENANGKIMYDFSSSSMEEANVTGAQNCPVIFEVSPSNAIVNIEGALELSNHIFDLEPGEYSYTVTANSYIEKSGIVTISDLEAEQRQAKTIAVSLKHKPSYSGGGGSAFVDKDKQDEKTETELQPETEQAPETEAEQNIEIETVFSDVKKGDWYYDAVAYAYRNKLFNGTGEGFSPNQPMTRAMLVTVLYRTVLPEISELENPFSDVSAGNWYTESIVWAAGNGLVQGVSNSMFAPDVSITREQLAVILYRYASLCGYEVEVKNENLSYSDAGSIADYAQEAMSFAVDAGVLKGTGGNLEPKREATRAEVATMLMRFLQGTR